MNWIPILLLLAAAGQPALAQESSRGAAGYSASPLLLPPKPGLDAEEAFRAGNRQPLPAAACDTRKPKCRQLIKYVEEYNQTLEALLHKSRQ